MTQGRKMSFREFIKKFGMEGVKNIAESYDNSDLSITFDTIAADNNLVRDAVTQIIKTAIIDCIISYNTCLQIKQKTHANQARHVRILRNDISPSDKFYDDLLQQRLENVNEIRDVRAVNTVRYYMENPNLDIQSICKKVGFSKRELSTILKNMIVYDMINDAEVNKLIKSFILLNFTIIF